jgi:hypothetical protein
VELVPRLERLVSAVSAQLLAGVERAFAIDRLVVWLERFERHDLLKAMLEGPRAEHVLQRTVERYLYAEGLFPITEFSLGQGRPDALFELSPPEYAGMQCVLIELKQAVKKNVTAADVRDAVTQALAQLQQYSSSLHAPPEWGVHEFFCIVAYAGKDRYLLPSDSAVKLVYLGDTHPSAGAKPLL